MSPRTSVGIIGAGVSGVSAAVHCKAEGLDITVFERSSVPGGVWVFDERLPPEPEYPSEIPSEADLAAKGCVVQKGEDPNIKEIFHSPPGPCYELLSNNVPTELMKLKVNSWPPGTPPIVNHRVLEDYIQDTARKYQVDKATLFDTKVEHAIKVGSKWSVETTTLPRKTGQDEQAEPLSRFWEFDRLIVASGHYHACRVPDIPGLSQWKNLCPSRIQHSKSYRNARGFENKTVLLIGAGVSAIDIAKELGSIATQVYQSSRGGMFDLPVTMLPSNATRIGPVASFSALEPSSADSLRQTAPIPGVVTLADGQTIQGIDHIILCTGYHMSYPFLKYLHSDTTPPDAADDHVLVTDGLQMHNLSRDIFYIPDPSLAFIGVPYHVATFSFFEYQAIAVARVFSDKAQLPTQQEMRDAYRKRIADKGIGRAFHSLMGSAESEYVDDLVAWLNRDGAAINAPHISGHSPEWRAAKEALMMAKGAFKPRPVEELPETIQERSSL